MYNQLKLEEYDTLLRGLLQHMKLKTNNLKKTLQSISESETLETLKAEIQIAKQLINSAYFLFKQSHNDDSFCYEEDLDSKY